MSWRAYHEATKHTPERLRRANYTLDWANMPNPYRHYEGVPVLDLAADPAAPEISAYDVLRGRMGTGFVGRLSALLFYSASISATKVAPNGGTYALRVNPSSGNLHPTEFHFATRGMAGWPDGLYHYRPSQHMAEQRGRGDYEFDSPLVFVLTTIAWREAWKYRERAYRYCLLDMGHAWQALELAARALGCTCEATGAFDDAALAARLGLAEDEWPLLVVTVRGMEEQAGCAGPMELLSGTPNELSPDANVPAMIADVHAATRAGQGSWRRVWPVSDLPAVGGRAFGETVRGRRSALDFVGGARAMPMETLLALLAVARVGPLTMYLYVHRVAGLAAGLYRFTGELELIRAGDQRVAAAGLSLGQDLAGNCCVAISIVAELEGAQSEFGERGYRYAHIEAGALGQRLYIAAEALGLRATGIGAFFDDRVHAYLELETGQVVYHFAIGYPVADPRLEY